MHKLLHSDRHLRLITDNLPVLIGYIDRDERFVYANKTYETMFDVRQEQIPGSLVVDIVGADIYALSKEHLQRALAGTPVQFERLAWHKGVQRWDYVTYVPDRHDDGTIAGLFAMVEDITERKRAEENRLLTSLVYESTSEGMMILAPDGAILDVNASFTRLSGYSQSEVSGKHLSDIAAETHDKSFFDAVRRTIAKTGEWQGEVWNRKKNGEDYLIALKLNTVYKQDGEPFRRFVLFSDITKKKATDDLIWKQANFDTLTGLPNRRMFHDKLRAEMRKTHRSRKPMALVFIDLDRFKEVNDTLGHAQGDVLLVEAAQRLRACVRATDTVARLGGDEFTIILGDVDNPNDVARIAELILKRIAEPFILGHDEALVSASIGITMYPDDGTDVNTLVKNADQAMYAAKAQGRNRFHYFAPFMQEVSLARKTLSDDLRDALDKGHIEVQYQTIIDLRSRLGHKAEALVRWRHPIRGMLNAREFIGIAETNGTIVAIGDWVFRQAAQLAKRLRENPATAGFQISVNKSALQFRDDGSQHREWLRYLDTLGLADDTIIVEVTEPMLQGAGKLITDKLLAFRDAGVQVSLDDFGTGHCSLAFLKRYDIDYLKINPDFIANLTTGSFEANLCEAIIVMAHKLGMKVIAEGVETELQLAILLQAGCDFGQGYLFSTPVDADTLAESLHAPEPACG